MVKVQKFTDEERKRRSGVGKTVSSIMARDAHGHFYKKAVGSTQPESKPASPSSSPAPTQSSGGLSGLLKKIFG